MFLRWQVLIQHIQRMADVGHLNIVPPNCSLSPSLLEVRATCAWPSLSPDRPQAGAQLQRLVQQPRLYGPNGVGEQDHG